MKRFFAIFCSTVLILAALLFGYLRLAHPDQYRYICYKISNVSLYRFPRFWTFSQQSDSISVEEVPQASEEISTWLAEEGIDTSIDPSYPDVTMTNLQGRWLFKNLSGETEELYFNGTQCTVTIPFLNMDGETYDCAIVNRSSEHLCPKLVIFKYPGETAGMAYYISEVNENSFYCAAQKQIFYRVE